MRLDQLGGVAGLGEQHPDRLHGRRAGADGVEQPVGLLDEREWKRIRYGYGDTSSFFDKDGEFLLDKSGALHRPHGKYR